MRTAIIAAGLLQLLLVAHCAIDTKPPEFCWRDSQTRGVGRIPSECPKEKQRIGEFCYTRCATGMARIGFDCYSICPPGFRDDGFFCRLAEYGRGGGYPWHFGDPLNDDGMIHRCQAENGVGNCEKNGLIYYPKCRPGFYAVGCCICRPSVPNCPNVGLVQGIDLSCAKKVSFGDPTVKVCPSFEDTEAGLCYPRCRLGYTGIGPICWGLAPKSWVECGMGAAKDSFTCGSIIWDQVSSVGNLALNILTLGSSAGISKAAAAGKSVERFQQLKKTFTLMQDALKKADKVKGLVDKYADARGEVGQQSDSVASALSINVNEMTEADIVRMTASIAAFLDPTGVASVIVAYSYPKCGDLRI